MNAVIVRPSWLDGLRNLRWPRLTACRVVDHRDEGIAAISADSRSCRSVAGGFKNPGAAVAVPGVEAQRKNDAAAFAVAQTVALKVRDAFGLWPVKGQRHEIESPHGLGKQIEHSKPGRPASLRLLLNPAVQSHLDRAKHTRVNQRFPNLFDRLPRLLVHEQRRPGAMRNTKEVGAHRLPCLGDLRPSPARNLFFEDQGHSDGQRNHLVHR